jgi:hypothetical protein
MLVRLAFTVTTTIQIYLSLPFISGLGNFLISVTHHGDQHVDEQYRDDHHENNKQDLNNYCVLSVNNVKKEYLGFVLVICALKGCVIVSKISH